MADIRSLIARWREDPGGTHRSWFLCDDRLKNFRSNRRARALLDRGAVVAVLISMKAIPQSAPESATSRSIWFIIPGFIVGEYDTPYQTCSHRLSRDSWMSGIRFGLPQ
jgi:hypothetical protein